MTVLYVAFVVLGAAMLIGAIVWARRTRHARRLWQRSRKTDTVAIVLELEDLVRELERTR
jgi:hypothetical protein